MINRITWKFFGAFILLTLIAVSVLNFFVSLRLTDRFEKKITENLRSNATLVGQLLKKDIALGQQEVIQQKVEDIAHQLGLRLTVIDTDGTVLGDSKENPALMESHEDRPEVIAAFKDGFGHSSRFSDTLGYNMKYVAVRVADGDEMLGVVRFALPLSEVQLETQVIYRAVLLGAVVAGIIALTIAYFVSRGISYPIREMKDTAQRLARGDFSKKLRVKSRDELGELAKSMNEMAEQLQLKIENLKQMDRVRTDFVANVSHELRTPLTSIKGYVETLADGAITDEKSAVRFISIIKKHVDRLENIISDLLSLSELELRKDSIEKAELDLKFLLEEVVLGFGHALAGKQQSLSIETEGGDFHIKADSDKIEQVFVNLIDNAIKYTKDGGQIKVSLSAQDRDIQATVEDNGIGIPEEHLNRVFERFYRVDKARSRELGGTGLGLGIAKHIVIAHHGEIRIESEVGKGTKVFVTLPKE
jgi:signal transduction histidine kinase